MCAVSIFIPALLTDITQRCDSFHKEWDFRPSAGTITVSKANSSAS